MSVSLHPATYLQGGPLSPLAPLAEEAHALGMESTTQRAYVIHAERGLEFFRVERRGAREAFAAAHKIRAMGWTVRVAVATLTMGLFLTCIVKNVPRHTDYTFVCS
jgi:hypothetical protein